MKKLILLLLLIPLLVNSQVVYDKNNQDYFIDYNTKKLNLNYNGTLVNGSFEELKGSDYYSYIVANGGDVHLVMKKFTDYEFYGIDILKGEYKDIIKGFNKGRKYGKKIQVIYSSLPSSLPKDDFDLMSEKQYLDLKKKQEFSSLIKESGYIGVYNIKILNHRNLNYSDLDYNGKITITEVGITIETDIPTLNLVRGSYNPDMSDEIDKGRFVCDITKGFDEFFSLSLNIESSVGAFTSMRGRTSTTTTFTIQ
tara:strand:+ start:689 stop:1447 length:759 start_codon:yes stop_codon:yes gene_type:complete